MKSKDFSAAVAVVSFNFSALTFTTSTTEVSAALNPPDSEAPAPSAADAKELTAVIICWLIFSTAKASAASTLSANGLNSNGSTPSGRFKTFATSSAVRPPSAIKVDVGETTAAPFGAVNMTPDKVAPDEESTVLSSVIATIL